MQNNERESAILGERKKEEMQYVRTLQQQLTRRHMKQARPREKERKKKERKRRQKDRKERKKKKENEAPPNIKTLNVFFLRRTCSCDKIQQPNLLRAKITYFPFS